MTNYAFKNKDRNGQLSGKIYADQAQIKDINQYYYCPNSLCSAHLFPCSINGSKKAYFAATHDDHRHIPNCPYGHNIDFDEDKYDEQAFNYDSALDHLMADSTKTNTSVGQYSKNNDITVSHHTTTVHPLRTIRQIYMMCKSMDIHDTYNSVKIWRMLVDNRSVDIYNLGIFGKRLIETTVPQYCYNPIEQEIYLELNPYNITLKFDDFDLYDFMKNRIYENSDKLIIVAGDWQNVAEYKVKTKIKSKRQVMVLR
ncbi:hypothetical protein [Lactobacillus johnsonii]|uniref:Uncharacterized protein n=1 Tax=Lactobacillus johnsonii TaxID=33959 RepID=A0A9X7TB38_LACJH|nr:hypothetical protein [Lactobacillus johnsonii]QIA88528.1 hypothetical protein FEE39_09805 [Lactobacillus johnsonii]